MSYTIKFSDPVNPDKIVIGTNTINQRTSLDLIGAYTNEYGEEFWTNILHLTENFSKDEPPRYPIQGQLWYDSANKALKLYDGTWSNITMDDTKLSFISLGNPDTIEKLTSDFEESEYLITSGAGMNSNNAVTKQYVDSFNGGIKTGKTANNSGSCQYTLYPNKYIIMHGVAKNIPGEITLPFEMQDINYSVVITHNTGFSGEHRITKKTVNSFTISGVNWMIVGYIKGV